MVALLSTGLSFGASTVAWLTPPDGSTFAVGTVVSATGQAAGAGQVGGTGLDLALVLDSSGSMWGAGQAAQRSAASALVNALPVASTSVGVVQFDSSASILLGLTPLSTGTSLVLNAINMVDASGGTTIGAGIDLAKNLLTGPGATPGRTQMMVVVSDGWSSGNPGASADIAVLAGVDAVHAVGMPGHSVSTMQDIVNGPDGILGNADDDGIYTSGSLDALISLFNGTSGNLVGLQNVSVTLPDGTVLANVPTDGLGNFAINGWTMQPGANVFQVLATATDNSTATATLTLYGVSQSVPDGGTTLTLLGLSLGAAFFAKKRLAC